MRRSTLFTRLCGIASLGCAALALILVFARYDAPAPRWDILAALGAGAVTAGAWVLACRAAPLLGPSTAPAVPGPRAEVPPPPRRLPSPARDTGRTAGAVLLLVTPLVLARLAAGSGGVLSGVVILLVAVSTVKTLGFARRRVSQADVRAKLRVLSEDAGRSELHAVRVRVGEPVRMRHLERGDKPGQVSATQYHWIVLRADGRELKLAAPCEEVGRAALCLDGREGWLCWPQRWKLIEAELPAAFVADSGEVLTGLSDPDEARPYLRAAVHPPAADRPVRRLPRTAKFSAPVHIPMLGGALLAALLAAPVLYVGPDRLPWALDWLLCALAAASVVVFPLRGLGAASAALPKGVSWTVREESDPSIA
ncbi:MULTISPECIES: hypothetical protein [Streptomyces]|uniref:hypothetical protein n=1 Tax=Streptomyces TaxID=1883 RepID=UPI0029AEE419|nr:hypothetical protein [Streptomyces sp. WI03-4A]MDX2593059.1 hypothetical protein [Streptomyces sp. WI03-4A]